MGGEATLGPARRRCPMSTLQFSLFFIAIVVGYVLIHLRLVRFEAYLQRQPAPKAQEDRLQTVADSVAHVRLESIEDRLARQHDELLAALERLVVACREVGGERLPAQRVSEPIVVPRAAAGAELLRSLVETRLLQLGYGDLRIVSDLSGIEVGERADLRVEALRDQMPFKGVVTVRNGAVVDVALRSAAQSFP